MKSQFGESRAVSSAAWPNFSALKLIPKRGAVLLPTTQWQMTLNGPSNSTNAVGLCLNPVGSRWVSVEFENLSPSAACVTFMLKGQMREFQTRSRDSPVAVNDATRAHYSAQRVPRKVWSKSYVYSWFFHIIAAHSWPHLRRTLHYIVKTPLMLRRRHINGERTWIAKGLSKYKFLA